MKGQGRHRCRPCRGLCRLLDSGLVVLLRLRALEGQRVAVLDAAVAVQVVVARRETGVFKAHREVPAALALTVPCGADPELAAEDLVGRSVLVLAVEHAVEVSLYLEGECLNRA